jgi:hypothetical protein
MLLTALFIVTNHKPPILAENMASFATKKAN